MMQIAKSSPQADEARVSYPDVGVPVNPKLVQGRMQNPTFRDYKIFSSKDMPKFTDIIVVTDEPHGPFGVKAAAEIPIDGPAPAVANALFNATGLRMRSIPLTAERVWAVMSSRTPLTP